MNCSYRNCGLPLTGRNDKKLCNRKCKDNERTYIKRETKRLKKEKETYKNMIEDYKNLENKDLLELFSKIYGK